MKYLFYFLFTAALITSCKYDEIMRDPDSLECMGEYSYENNMKILIGTYCSYSGCHDGSSTAPGDFTSFNGLKSRLENGQFEQRVFEFRDMPPADATGPKELTEFELDNLRCWAADGFPEN